MKNLENLDLDSLLELAADKPKKKRVRKVTQIKDVDEFIAANKIVSGRTKVPTDLIYFHYFLWKKTRLVNRTEFFRYFKTKFKQSRNTYGLCYLLNHHAFDLTPQGYFRARAYFRKQRDDKKKAQTP